MATCECGAKKAEVWSWGEYVVGKWRTVDWFCEACFADRVKGRLLAHAAPCGCSFVLEGYRGTTLPAWLTLETACDVAS
jgi:hypothetical protein